MRKSDNKSNPPRAIIKAIITIPNRRTRLRHGIQSEAQLKLLNYLVHVNSEKSRPCGDYFRKSLILDNRAHSPKRDVIKGPVRIETN